MIKITIFSLLIIILDQIIKFVVIQNMELYSSIIIIKNFFNITYVQNIGAAFSILSGNVVFLSLISLIVLVAIYIYLSKKKSFNKIQTITYSMLIGGIVGNMIDRIFRGFVIDYLDFSILKYNFPVFNFADICIVVSAIILLIFSIKEEKSCNTK